MDIYEYLSSKSIIISDERFKGNVEVSISEQIQLISDAHKRLLAGKEAIIPRIQSVIGKDFEAYKVDIKKNKNYISKITNNKGTSYIEDYLIDEGTSIIKNAEETLSLLDLEIYFSIIKRSMKRYEICGTFMHGGSGGGGRFSDGGGVGSADEDLAALPSDDGLSEEPDPLLE